MKTHQRFQWIVIPLTLAVFACSSVGLLNQAEPTDAQPSQPVAPLPVEPTLAPVLSITPTFVVTETSTPPSLPTITETAFVFSTATGPRPSPSPMHFKIFEEVWGTIDQNYLYQDFNGLDWAALREEYLQRIEAGLSDEEFYQALFEMVYRLGDNHSTFFSPEMARQLDAEYAGEYEYVGIGVIHTPIPERKLLSIVLVFPGSPAEQVGLQPHDSILAVDGVAVFDEQGHRRNILRGLEGTTIKLTVQTPGSSVREVVVTRGQVVGEMPVPHRVVQAAGGKRIGYLLIPTFNEEQIDEKVRQAIQDLAASGPLDGLIVDNRHNGGGTSEVMLNTLAYFTSGQVGYFVQRENQEIIRVTGVNVADSLYLPLAVLVGPGTASFGEVFAGILKDLNRATILGETTNGNVELLRVFDFSDGSRAWIATATFRPINHPEQNWEESGIIPDFEIASRWDEVVFETDPVIQAALGILGQ